MKRATIAALLLLALPCATWGDLELTAKGVDVAIAEANGRATVTITFEDGTTLKRVYGGASPRPPGPGPSPPGPEPTPPEPEPTPPAPPAPDSRFGLVKVATDSLSKVKPGGERFREALAKNFDAIASAGAAGAYQTVKQCREAISSFNRTTLGDAGEPIWRAWLYDVGYALDKLEDGGKIKGRDDYLEALEEIAKGLRAGKVAS